MVSTAVNRGHIIGGPPNFVVLRIFQIIFAVVVIGLAGYVIYYFPSSLSGTGPALSIFTAIATLITVIYILVGQYSAASIYNYWAILGLEIFCLCFWVISFALTAKRAADFFSFFDDGYCIDATDGFCYLQDTFASGLDSMAALAGIGGLMFLLFIISLAIFSVFLQRHRAAGGHCTPERMGLGAGVPAQTYQPNGGGAIEPKFEMQPTTQTYAVDNPQNGVNPSYQQQYQGNPQQQYQQTQQV